MTISLGEVTKRTKILTRMGKFIKLEQMRPEEDYLRKGSEEFCNDAVESFIAVAAVAVVKLLTAFVVKSNSCYDSKPRLRELYVAESDIPVHAGATIKKGIPIMECPV
ncbi:MAG: hypothetical protein J5861_06390 [Desulfovibrio sp.]|nr:hypothetical protein [Desulfovibrio sp.]